ncbi:MAG: PEP-CTERM sorting domain-containing protein [Gammaproteobacteria bacterium]|nr:MAG: PEP-CTERM sorting domain-containing protein [Gammaproteobacteria bacterium]
MNTHSRASKILQICAIALFSTSAMATSINLSPWVSNGTGNWRTATDNLSVTQTKNQHPTVFINNQDSQGYQYSADIRVNTTSDDDYIGFVLGYDNGDLTNNSADYLLIDWKQGNQNYAGGTGTTGLAVSRVSGALGTGHSSGAWWHDATDGVTELQRATNLGNTGWADKTTYSFDLFFTSTLVEVFVNGVKELSISGLFDNGSFGFYNYSQGNVTYAATDVSAVPIPAALFLFGPALLGGLAFRRKAQSTAS